MSNQVIIISTVFQNFKTGEVKYGLRVKDSFSQLYCDDWTKAEANASNVKILTKLMRFDRSNLSEELKDFLEYLQSSGKGVLVNDEYLDSEKVFKAGGD